MLAGSPGGGWSIRAVTPGSALKINRDLAGWRECLFSDAMRQRCRRMRQRRAPLARGRESPTNSTMVPEVRARVVVGPDPGYLCAPARRCPAPPPSPRSATSWPPSAGVGDSACSGRRAASSASSSPGRRPIPRRRGRWSTSPATRRAPGRRPPTPASSSASPPARAPPSTGRWWWSRRTRPRPTATPPPTRGCSPSASARSTGSRRSTPSGRGSSSSASARSPAR